MIVFSLRVKVAPEHCNELLHFVTAILEDVRLLDGCLGCHCYQSVEDDCHIYLVERWLEYEHLKIHMHSDLYSAVSGAFKVLAGGVNVELTYTDAHEDQAHLSGEGKN